MAFASSARLRQIKRSEENKQNKESEENKHNEESEGNKHNKESEDNKQNKQSEENTLLYTYIWVDMRILLRVFRSYAQVYEKPYNSHFVFKFELLPKA